MKANSLLTKALEKLPTNYNFEIYKSILKIQDVADEVKKRPLVALQMPDGLAIFALLLSDVFEAFADCECVILGDITYGACCIDDLGAKTLNCDLLIHYGHSCLVPVTTTLIKVLYVFVDIDIDIDHLLETIYFNFPDKTKQFSVN